MLLADANISSLLSIFALVAISYWIGFSAGREQNIRYSDSWRDNEPRFPGWYWVKGPALKTTVCEVRFDEDQTDLEVRVKEKWWPRNAVRSENYTFSGRIDEPTKDETYEALHG